MSQTSTEQRGKQDQQASIDRDQQTDQQSLSSRPQGGVTPATQTFFVQIGGEGQPQGQQFMIQSVVDSVLPMVGHELLAQIQRDPQLASAFVPLVAEQLVAQIQRDPQLAARILQAAGIKPSS